MKQDEAKQSRDDSGRPAKGRMIGLKEAMEYTGLGRNFFHYNRKNGTLPFKCYDYGPKSKKYDTAELDNFMRMRIIPAGKKQSDNTEVCP